MIRKKTMIVTVWMASVAGLLVLWPPAAWARSPLIDPDYAEAQKLEQEQSQAVCGEIKKFLLQIDCTTKVSNELNQTGRFRGTEEYVQKHYLHLGWEGLEQKLEELRQAAREARSELVAESDPIPGEVTAENLRSEMIHIKTEFHRRSKATMDEIKEEYENRGKPRQ